MPNKFTTVRKKLTIGEVWNNCLVIFILSTSVYPPLNCQQTTVQVAIGQAAILPCYVDIIGNVQVVWLSPVLDLVSFNEEIRMPDGRYSLVREYKQDWNLRIASTMLGDAGNYSCQVTLGKDVIKNVVELVHLISPTAKINASYLEVEESKGFAIECRSTGYPTPSVEWQFYRYNESKKFVLQLEPQAILKINNVTEKDSGRYVCFSSNGVAPISLQSCYINIRFAPEIKMSYTKISQNRGSETKLECFVNSNPSSEVVWSFSPDAGREFVQIDAVRTDKSAAIASNKSVVAWRGDGERGFWYSYALLIKSVSFDEAGFYKCVAENSLGVASQSVELAVQEKNNFEMVSKPSDTTAFAGGEVTVPCTVKRHNEEKDDNSNSNNKNKTNTNESFKVVWLRTTQLGSETIFKSSDWKQPANPKFRVVGQYDLEIKNLATTDEGFYVCRVGSQGSEFNFTMYLSIIKQSPAKECSASTRMSSLTITLIVLLSISIIAFVIVFIILLHSLHKINLKCLDGCAFTKTLEFNK